MGDTSTKYRRCRWNVCGEIDKEFGGTVDDCLA